MRTTTFAMLFLAAIAAQAPSASAQVVEYRGVFVVTALTEACEDFWNVGDTATARFAPPNVGDNGPSTRLSYYFRFFSENYTLPKGTLTSGFKKVNATGVGRGGFSFNARMRLTKLSPKKIKANTKFIDMTGQIQDFDTIEDCDITFRATFTRRV